MARTAVALIIGNEVLSGKVADANGPYLIRALRDRGVELRRIHVVPDEIDAIVDAVTALRPHGEVLFTSGGIGPPHDDVTVAAIARALGRPVVRMPQIETLIRERYGTRLTPEALRLADAPEGAVFVDVPGLWLPALTVENVVLLPGIPELFRMQLDALVDRFREAPIHLRALLLSEYEHAITAALNGVVARFPDVAIGSYPVLGASFKVRLTFEARSHERVDEAVAAMLAALPDSAVIGCE